MIKLIATYSKRLGLPGFSSHQYSIEIEAELVTTDEVPAEAARIYGLLQANVDAQLQNPGFVPPTDYGIEEAPASPSNNRSANGAQRPTATTVWRCSQKQRALIEALVEEHQLDKNEVDHLARQRFGKGVRDLDKVEASGLIDELIDNHGGQKPPPRNARRSAYAGMNGNAGGQL